MAPKIPTIAIIGRPNVGKSTLFNRILGQRRAIVEDQPGVTRDRLYAMVDRFSVPFLLVDTGGIDVETEDELGVQVREQALVAAEEADVLLVLFDGAAGCQAGDQEVVDLLRGESKPIAYVVNKCDGDEQALRVAEFYALGIDPIHDISALHGRRVNALVEEILAKLPNYSALRSSILARKEREQEAEREADRLADADAEQQRIEDAQFDESSFGDRIIDENSGLSIDDEDELGTGEGDDWPGDEPVFAPVFIPEEEGDDVSEYDREHRLLPLDRSKPRLIKNEDDTPQWNEEDEAEGDVIQPIECIRVAIVGRPNVGKSTLLNTLTGDRRAITSPLAGTTRDNLDVQLKRDGQDYLLVDTAGLRKKGRVAADSVERYSTLRAIGALGECDVAIVVIDGATGPTDQDVKILGLAHERGVGVVIAVNKWDLVTKSHKTVHTFTENIRNAFKFAPYAPIVYLSALSGRRCPRVIDTVRAVAYERMKRISTGKLNQILKRALQRFSPAPYRGREIKLYYAVQVDVAPPRIALFFNYPRGLHFSFLRFLKNSIREEFRFEGTEVKLIAKKR